MEAIDDYINHSREDFRPDEKAKNALFLSRKHNRISVRTVEHMVKTYATAALGSNTKISPHKLRATFATEAYAAFSDIGIVATCLGHRDMNTTKEHYAKISEESKQKVTGLSIEKSN